MLTEKILKEFFHYDPETGIFTRRKITNKRNRIGQRAGFVDGNGYIRIKFYKKDYQVGRLAWLYMTGEWPSGEIDHINHVPSDNRWKNLRNVSRALNQQNRIKASAASKCGVLGIRKHNKGYWARIHVDGKRISLGVHPTQELAYEAYVIAKRKLHAGNTL